MELGLAGAHYHVGLVTRDLDEAMPAVGRLLGLRWAEVIDGTTSPPLRTADGPAGWGLRRAVHSTGGPVCIELLEGDPGSVWDTAELAVAHHVAYWVDDVAAAVRSLAARGWAMEVTVAGAGGEPAMFAYLTRPGHARIELTDAIRRPATLERLGWPQPDGP